MSKEAEKTKEGTNRSKFRFSLVYKLNLHLWLRLAAIFLVLDLVVFAAFGAAVVVYGEQMAAKALTKIGNLALVDREAQTWLDLAGVQVEPLTGKAKGVVVPSYFQGYLPAPTAAARRRLLFTSQEPTASFLSRLKQVVYRLEFAETGPGYGVTVAAWPLTNLFPVILAAILIYQILTLLKNIFAQSRIIRRTLQPITELAEQARRLNVDRGRGPFTPEQMQALAGKLNDITAAKLDTRIEISSTQDELKNLAAAINGMLDRINEAYYSQARFVSDASHELRTPIAAIQGYANLLDRWGKYDEKALQESIDAIKEEAANMKDLIEQLLFLARGDNHRMHLDFTRVNLAAVAAVVIKETEMISESHHISSDLQPVYVIADLGLIKQALRILVDNALKYTPAGGEIAIATSEDEKNARLVVQDNGIGIPDEAVPYIFERFYRADESRARKTGGTGLGLSIAQWIVQRHGGYMDVLSREEIGTRIGIVIPAAPALIQEISK